MTDDEQEIMGAIAAAYGALPGVVAVAMAGSQIAGETDAHSDVDLYIYADDLPSLTDRAAVAHRFASTHEIGNTAWEPGDEWTDARTGRHVDVMYRTPAWITDQLERVLVRHEASVGYSTGFWYNVRQSAPLVDPDDWYRRLQAWARQPYPAELKHAILAMNHPILRHKASAYRHQIARAIQRGDGVSVQHRLAALLASYFDVLFALNELPHPGEKRLLAFAREYCPKLPADIEDRVAELLALPATPATTEILTAVDRLLDDLDVLLEEEGLVPAPLTQVETSTLPTDVPGAFQRAEPMLQP